MPSFLPLARALVARHAEAEVVEHPPATVRLLADASSTGGGLSAIKVRLEVGGNGARPHYHRKSSELHYVLSGSLDMLVGSDIVTVAGGDLVVVPPQVPHAFAASANSAAELLLVVMPGSDRFDYYRMLGRISAGQEHAARLAEVQDLYDTYFSHSPEWEVALTSRL